MKHIKLLLIILNYISLPMFLFGQETKGIPLIEYDNSSYGMIRGELKIISIKKSVYKNDSLINVENVSTNKIDDTICLLKSEAIINSLKIEGRNLIYLNSDFYLYEVKLNFNRRITIYSYYKINSIDSFILEILKKNKLE